MITIFAVTGRLLALAIAKPVPDRNSGGMAIPLVRYSPFPNSSEGIDLDAISSHAISVREKILTGLDNYETNTGTMHPFAVKQSDSSSGLGTRGATLPLENEYFKTWTGEISIGTPAKTFKVLIDTGAADMWVLETGCRGISRNRDLWDPNSSESAEHDGMTFRFAYTEGTIVKGFRYTDKVTIAGFTADPQTFGSVTSYTSKLPVEGYAVGLLGLAFPSVSRFGEDPLFQSLVSQNSLTNPTFSFKLSSSGAEMYIGGTNDILYNGVITYIPVTNAVS